MPDWKTLSSEIVYETPWIKVHRDEVLNQNGKSLTFSYMEVQHGSVFVVAVDQQGRIFLQQVYRHTLGERVWEIPAGFRDPDEDPITAGKRELQEEADLISDDWTDLGKIWQVIGVGKVPLNVLLARNVRRGNGSIDKDEDIDSRRFMAADEIDEMTRDGTLFNSPVIAAIAMTRLHGLTFPTGNETAD